MSPRGLSQHKERHVQIQIVSDLLHVEKMIFLLSFARQADVYICCFPDLSSFYQWFLLGSGGKLASATFC